MNRENLARWIGRRTQHASALLVVLVLTALLVSLVVTNSVALHRLGQEIGLLDQRQRQQFEPGSPARFSETNQAVGPR